MAAEVPDRRRRRWPWVIGGLVIITVVLAGLFWFVFVPSWRPPLRGGERLLYIRDDWEGRYPVRSTLDRPLWHFRFLRRPDLDTLRVLQIHGFAQVQGISGRVDLNIMRPADDGQRCSPDRSAPPDLAGRDAAQIR